MPQISVLMPVYNGEKFVKKTIDSILNQSYTDFEFIIVNDGSTDGTKQVLENCKDDRIKIFHLEENRGVGFASNFAVEKANCKYIARIDSDDIYHKDKLMLQKEFLDSNQDIALVKTLVEYFGDEKIKQTERYNSIKNILEKDKNSAISSEDISKQLYWHICVPNTSIMVRAEVMKEFGYDDLRYGEDYSLFYKMNVKGYKMGTVNKKLVNVRVSSESITAKNKEVLYENVFHIKKEIIEKLFEKGKVYLWGAGSFGILVKAILATHDLTVEGFIDSDTSKHGNKIDGLEVISPEILDKKEKIKIITTSQPGRNSIIDMIENKGYKHLKDYVVYL